MQYHEAKWIASCAEESQYPQTDLPEILFAGRSNAGKSSLINALVNRKNLAYKGKTPGKTKLLNFFLIDNEMVFTDAPGYGYAKGGNQLLVDFGCLMETYFHTRKQLRGLLLVLDIRRVPNDDDLRMASFAKDMHIPILAICTKADKLSYSQQLASINTIAKTLQIEKENIHVCSSIKKTGMDEIWDSIRELTA